MCGKIFDVADDKHDNDWVVENEEAPFTVTHKSDGAKFVVGDLNDLTEGKLLEEKSGLPPLSREL